MTEFEGTVETLTKDDMVVRGKRMAIISDTLVEGSLEAGQKVEVEALTQLDGAFLATKIKVEERKPVSREDKPRGPNEGQKDRTQGENQE